MFLTRLPLLHYKEVNEREHLKEFVLKENEKCC